MKKIKGLDVKICKDGTDGKLNYQVNTCSHNNNIGKSAVGKDLCTGVI